MRLAAVQLCLLAGAKFPAGTLASIIRQSGLSKQLFVEY
jgi:hypothetical protein